MKEDKEGTMRKRAPRSARESLVSAQDTRSLQKTSPSKKQKRPAKQEGNQRRIKRTRGTVRQDRRSRQRGESRSARTTSRGRGPWRSRGVPLPATLFLVVAAAVTSVLITRNVYTPQVENAQHEASVAKSQNDTLVKQLSQITTGQEEANKKGSSKSTTSSGKTDGSKNSSASSGVEDQWVDSGTYTTGDEVLDTEVKAFCDSHANSSMSRDAAMLEVYKAVAWSPYVERDEAQHPSGKNWRINFARMYYENGCSGNCYEFAAFLQYCMQYLGYDDAVAEGVAIELASGNWGEHGIVYVTNTDGTACLCDTSRGTDGYMLSKDVYNVKIEDFENA